MTINGNTKIMARLHREMNTRGMNIYNPYFEKTRTDALYLLFHNSKLKPLIEGLKNFNLAGAIPAGFEKDPTLIDYMDDLDPIAKKVGKVGIIQCRNSRLTGYYQAGYGLAESIERIVDVTDKKIVIFGAGQVVQALLTHWELKNVQPQEVWLYNRTIERAEDLASTYAVVKQARPLNELTNAQGDVFINATYAGSPWGKQDDSLLTKRLVEKFDYIADVTFVPLEPKLIKYANSLKKKVSPGWQMFLYQGKMCLEKILDIEVDEDVLAKYIISDFKTNWV